MNTKPFFFLSLMALSCSVQAKELPVVPVGVSQAIKALFNQSNVNCRVVGIVDGDTFTCLTADNNRLRVRMNNIDAPEKSQAYGQKAKQALSSLIFNKSVSLKIKSKDRYGRSLADVTADGRNINKIMVSGGYAWAYRQYLSDDSYLVLENDARANKRGLWADSNPIEPSQYRHKK